MVGCRYLLRQPDARLEADLGYLTPEGHFGVYSPDDPEHDPWSPDALPPGTRIRSDDGQTYEVVGRAKREIPDLYTGVLFVRPVDQALGV